MLLLIQHVNILKNDLAIIAMYSYNRHPAQPSEPGFSLGFFLGSIS
jgi:hypothetical protein